MRRLRTDGRRAPALREDYSTFRTDHLQIISTVHDLNVSGQTDKYIPDLYDLYDLAHVAGWGPYNLHGLQQEHLSLESDPYYADPTQLVPVLDYLLHVDHALFGCGLLHRYNILKPYL